VAGLHDWTIDGVHLCLTRLKLLETNTMPAFDPTILADVEPLRTRSGAELRALGRLGHPMRRRRGDDGFQRITWDEALDAIAAAIRRAGGERTAMYITSRGLTNESYYVAGKAARAMGVASIDSAARVCHAPSTVGLKPTVGVAASTCSLQDVIETDLVVLWGANVANNQPVFTKYLYLAKARGARVVVINPYLEPGLERYWVPSSAESALFGTKLCDLHVPVRPGGDVALANALLQRLIARQALDPSFIAAHTDGWEDVAAALVAMDHDELLAQAGVTRGPTRGPRRRVRPGQGGGLCVEHGHHAAPRRRGRRAGDRERCPRRGNVGRDGCGLMPIRGHSGVQGGAERSSPPRCSSPATT
jgi:anaerobic selenocysteine-containing dehydrogenase